MKETSNVIVIGLFLMAVCVVASFGLAMTNRATAPLIAEQKRLAQEAAMKEVTPGAVLFEEKMLPDGATYFIGKDSVGTVVGKAIKVAPKGYGGPVVTMVGVDLEGKVTGIKVLEMTETPGLGAKAKDTAFSVQFKGKTLENIYLRAKDEKKGEIDAITAATITSKAVTGGVRAAVEAIADVE